jgi:hypothetical protein
MLCLFVLSSVYKVLGGRSKFRDPEFKIQVPRFKIQDSKIKIKRRVETFYRHAYAVPNWKDGRVGKRKRERERRTNETNRRKVREVKERKIERKGSKKA